MNAAIYCRISEDREGAGLGVERQRKDCLEVARKHRWHVAGIYVDNDISAFSGKKRPEYRRLLSDVVAERVDVIIAWHTDRLHRSPRELEEFIDLCDKHTVHVETVRAGELDLKTPAGRAVARTLGAWARYESEHRSERIRRKSLELRQQGVPHGGGARCYGYARDNSTVVPEEAAVIREAASRTLAGESLRSICIDLNLRDIGTSRGNKWSTPRLRQLLLAPRIAGLIEHHTAGRVRGKWPAILSEEQRTRLVALLTDPSRRTNPGAPRRRLLSGVLYCGACGVKLSGSVTGKAGHLTEHYRCAKQEHRGCGKVSISAHLIEPYVVEAILSRLDNLELGDAGSSEDDTADTEALALDRGQLEELASLYAKREITAAEWIRARTEIDGRIAQRTRRIAERTVDDRLRDLLAHPNLTVRNAWPSLSLEQRRSILSSVLERITVNPTRRASERRSFDPTRLVPVWRA